jgi:CHAT domain-containing protein
LLEGTEQQATLGRARAAFDEALQERTADAVPASWALTQREKAHALTVLAKVSTGDARVDAVREAVAAYDAALLQYPRELMPQMHRMVTQSAGALLFQQGEWAHAARYLAMALDALDDLYRLSITARGQSAELLEGSDVAAELAFALVSAGEPSAAMRAAQALERSRARATGEALARQQAEQAAAGIVAPELIRELQSASERLIAGFADDPDKTVPVPYGDADTSRALERFEVQILSQLEKEFLAAAQTIADALSTDGEKLVVTKLRQDDGLPRGVGSHVQERLTTYEAAKAARAEYDDVLARIRAQIPDFLRPTSPLPDALNLLGPNQRMAYMASTSAGGVLVLLQGSALLGTTAQQAAAWHDAQSTTAQIKDLSDDLLRAQTEPGTQGLRHLNASLARAMVALGAPQGVLARLVAECRKDAVRHVVAIASGRLGLLPLHAALIPAAAQDGTRAPLQDDLRVSYAPSAGVWRMCRERERERAGTIEVNMLLVGNPLPQLDASPLPGAAVEAQVVASVAGSQAFRQVRPLLAEAATRESVLSALQDYGKTLTHAHFACHGIAEVSAPEQSALLLAQGARLMVQDLRDPANAVHLERLRLAVLSACQTGIPGTGLPDEVVGLPAGWLQAGAAGVLASLWPVSDDATVALMGRFYELHLGDGLDPVDALWLAQRWLRGIPSWRDEYQAAGALQSATGPEASEKVAELARGRGGPTAVPALESGDNNEDEESEPTVPITEKRVRKWQRASIWAAFTVYGV